MTIWLNDQYNTFMKFILALFEHCFIIFESYIKYMYIEKLVLHTITKMHMTFEYLSILTNKQAGSLSNA